MHAVLTVFVSLKNHFLFLRKDHSDCNHLFNQLCGDQLLFIMLVNLLLATFFGILLGHSCLDEEGPIENIFKCHAPKLQQHELAINCCRHGDLCNKDIALRVQPLATKISFQRG